MIAIYEVDQISLVQPVILLGFWSTDTEDPTQVGHGLASLSAFAKLWDSIIRPSQLLPLASLPNDENACFAASGGVVS